ncbi:MAG TPA: MBL fold metallo-hydrolase [Bacteroidales bacterium]|nr:MBL fold metallo-hydrolase [Bacteroidales bacterium]
MKTRLLFFILISLNSIHVMAQTKLQSDTIRTSSGILTMTFIGHGTLMFTWNDKVLHVDPVDQYADYESLPDADLILVTHHHGDHLDVAAMDKITKPGTVAICTESCLEKLPDGIAMKNGDERTVEGITIQAVPAYNIVHKRSNGEPFHPKGVGNGYVIRFGDKKIYVAGDTENIPEMAGLKDIYCAFLPMNLPYTMTPEMVSQAVRLFHPDILYPYHYGETDVTVLVELLRDVPSTELRIRNLK